MEPDISSQLLMQAGDIEQNPGPTRVDVKPPKCKECSGNIYRSRVGSWISLICWVCRSHFHKKCAKKKVYDQDNQICHECVKVVNTQAEEVVSQTEVPTPEEDRPKQCAICKYTIRKGYDYLRCSECNAGIHKDIKCSDESRDAVKKIDRSKWRCRGCLQRETEREKRVEDAVSGSDRVEYVVKNGGERTTITILQWNADSIKSKLTEVRNVLKNNKVDILMVQETKLTSTEKIPNLPGYTVLSAHRKQVAGKEKNRGGGLLTAIKNDIPYREVKDVNLQDKGDGITEWQSVEIPISESETWRITNMYIPSERAGDVRDSQRDTVVTTRLWPAGSNDMLLGDLNAHAISWDNALEEAEKVRGIEEKRGEMIEEWMLKNDMACLNDGRGTHSNRKTGKESTPDLTIVHSTKADLYEWNVIEELGGSDHKPILIKRQLDNMKKVNTKKTYKWNLKQGDLVKFSEQVEKDLPERYEKKNLNKLEKILRKTITKAATTHVRKKLVKPSTVTYVNEDIKEMVKERNALRKDFKEGEKRQEWLKKCAEVREAVRKEKEERWKEYVDTLEATTNSREVWRTIRNIDGKNAPRKDNEVLVVNKKGYTDDKDKARMFMQTYKQVSRIPREKEDLIIKRSNRKFLKKRPTESLDESEADLTMIDLERAIKDTDKGKAAGEDDIPNDFIHALGPRAKKFLLHIFNRVWQGEEIPHKWRTAVIKPLLKEGKDPSQTASYRPIALTSCLGKVLEKIIADRMNKYLEMNGLLNQHQAGFRSDRCTTDQVLKLVQMATDTMQNKDEEGAATLITFFDFAKAYDKVWREGLLYKMIELGLPYRFVKYTRLFLSARKTCVEVNGTRSDNKYLNEGLPQGSAISPLLFLIFINDITNGLDDNTVPSLFADDTAVWVVVGDNRSDAERRMQKSIDAIVGWAKTWKMRLNADKTEALIISSDQKDLKWKPQLKLNRRVVRIVKEYRFLGVTIDGGLRFTSHVRRVIAKGKRRNNILRCLAGKDWGQSLETQRALYLTYIRSAMEYASSSWYQWISTTNKGKLEAVQNQALRVMCRLCKTCPIDFLRLESGVEPLEVRMEKNCMITWERYERLPENDKRYCLMKNALRRHGLTTRHGWRYLTGPNMTQFECNRNMPAAQCTPWASPSVTMEEVELDKKKEEYSQDELKQLTLSKIAEINADIEIYTDGSTSGQQINGGAGIFIRKKDGTVTERMSMAAGKYCSSYDGECVAMMEATRWIREKPVDNTKYAIFTDSLSLVCALKTNNWKDSHEWLRWVKFNLSGMQKEVHICWIPSHCGTVGNEEADRLADDGAMKPQAQAPVTFGIVKAKIRNLPWRPTHNRAMETYGDRLKPKYDVEKKWPAAVRRLYSRLRTGHAVELMSYAKFICKEEDDTCPLCEDAIDKILHVICKCPGLEARRRMLSNEPFTINMMVTHPEMCRTLLASRFDGLATNNQAPENTTS